jgi:hypothetical protein
MRARSAAHLFLGNTGTVPLKNTEAKRETNSIDDAFEGTFHENPLLNKQFRRTNDGRQ